jgi:arabinogalactan oligomer/maltooligosaccharide transport system substrate-binding protein
MKRPMNRVLYLLFTAAIILTFGLAACTSETEAPAPTQPPSVEETEVGDQPTPEPTQRPPVDVTVWVYNMDNEAVLNAFTTVANEWAQINGDTVTIVNYPYFELLGKVEIAFPAGEGPDLVEMPHTDVGVWAQAGLIAPLSEGVLSESERALYQPSAMDTFIYDGQVYGIPQIADIVLLMYNKELISEPPETMEELIQVAKELTEGDTYGFLMLDNNMWYGWGFLSGYGAYIFGQEEDGSFNPNDLGFFSPGAIEGMQYLKTLRYEHNLIPEDIDWNIFTGTFTEGRCAMIFNNANQAGIYRQAGIDVGMAVMPELPNGQMPLPLLNVHGWGINAFSDYQQAASELAVYLGANLPVPLFEVSPGDIPVRIDAMEDPVIAENPDAFAMSKQVEFSQAVPNLPEMGSVWVPVNNAFELVIKGEKTAEQALYESAQAVKSALADFE